jgi:hypothetical protein
MINSATATHNCNIVTMSDHHDPDAAAAEAEADRPYLEYPHLAFRGLFEFVKRGRQKHNGFEFVKRETE